MHLQAQEVPVNKTTAPAFNVDSPVHKAVLMIGLTVIFSAAFIYFTILPLKKRIAECISNTAETIAANDLMNSVIRTTNEKKSSVEELQKIYADLQQKGILTPLLNSYAMRAKTLVQPIALQSGLMIENVRELPPIPLQQPLPLKDSAFYRQPVEFTAYGSYTQLTAFVSFMEKELPMSILSSLKITAQQRIPEIHNIQMSYEWPARTSKITEPKN
jgi:hypothetical protein